MYYEIVCINVQYIGLSIRKLYVKIDYYWCSKKIDPFFIFLQ